MGKGLRHYVPVSSFRFQVSRHFVLFQVSGFSFETFETWRSQLETLKLGDSHLFVFVCKESEKA